MFEVQGGENLPRLLDLISFGTQEVGGRYDDDEADDEDDDHNDHHEQDGGGDNDNHHNPERN